ncbi:hypothetical protein FT641_20250 [Bacillus paranthracis]|uniref:hypothetical protein n=1 Tax=Bacillus paranthracis TaxID=2026186 RepID=UPI001879FFD9|nr:hypothetical protein [Bacillus paranthracis]MBE7114605.1 hypothetical protein [Bacillus paranthracis]MBE7155028.1 hypothetical protein [Bacillus paranthracis]
MNVYKLDSEYIKTTADEGEVANAIIRVRETVEDYEVADVVTELHKEGYEASKVTVIEMDY